MKVGKKHYRSLWLDPQDNRLVHSIDQRKLPFSLEIEQFTGLEPVCEAIRDMHLRGAPLIGVAAAFGMYLASLETGDKDLSPRFLSEAAEKLKATRPTAVNLEASVERQLGRVKSIGDPEKIRAELEAGAVQLWEEEIENCRLIGVHGLKIIEELCKSKGKDEINILTHCNAGWLACVDYGTATAPIYFAHDKGIKVHVWVDETRPRNQGARLTAWELGQHGVSHTLIPDNTGGHLMQHGKVDMVIVGSDRTTRTGDVANKIGTYLKALAAFDNQIPFYVALPSSSIDWEIKDGIREIPIEERNADEVHYLDGESEDEIRRIRISPHNSPAANYGFDVTPARLVTGLITEKGVCESSEKGLQNLFKKN